ncbi:MAG: hypothetical protein ABR550_06240 [Wenzhouxiangellaceae bacterium]
MTVFEPDDPMESRQVTANAPTVDSKESARRPDPDQIAQALASGALESAPCISASNQGRVFRLQLDGYRLAVKTPAGSGLKAVANRIGLKREHQAYRRLDGLDGFAHCFGLFENRWLVLDFVSGTPFRDADLTTDWFESLLVSIRAMHQRGVAHGDLKRKSNLLVGAAGEPVILDLGASLIRRPGFHPLNRAMFNVLRQTDLNAWIKLKYGGYHSIAPRDRELLRRSLFERLLSRLRT